MSVGAPLTDRADETFWRRLTRGTLRGWHDAEWAEFAGDDWPRRVMEFQATDDFHAKQGRSTARIVLTQGEHRLGVYLKRHYDLGWGRALLAMFWPSRSWSPALREARNLEWARQIGLSVPETLAVGEFIGPGLRFRSFLATRELEGMIGLHEAIPAAALHLSTLDFQRWKAGLIRELARITLALHSRRRFHKDLYLCHFFIPREDTRCLPRWKGRVHLIDFHRLKHHGWTWRYWRIKDLSQLLFSSEMPEIDDRDRLLFLRLYAGSRKAAGRLIAWLRLKAGRYRRHNEHGLGRVHSA